MDDEAIKLIHKFKTIKRACGVVAILLIILSALFTTCTCETETLIIKWGFMPAWLTVSIVFFWIALYFVALVKINLAISDILLKKGKPSLYYAVSVGVNKVSGELLETLELETAFFNGSFDYAIVLGERMINNKNLTYSLEGYTFLVDMYFFTENLDGLERLKDSLLEKTKTNKNKLAKKRINVILSTMDICAEILKENYFKADELYKTASSANSIKNVEKHPIEATMSKYLLATIYLGKNETAKAKTEIDFIITHGGETFYVKKAEELLLKING